MSHTKYLYELYSVVTLGRTLQDTELENSTVTNYCLCPAVILQCIFICILMFLHTPSGQESYYLNYLYCHVILQCFKKT